MSHEHTKSEGEMNIAAPVSDPTIDANNTMPDPASEAEDDNHGTTRPPLRGITRIHSHGRQGLIARYLQTLITRYLHDCQDLPGPF